MSLTTIKPYLLIAASVLLILAIAGCRGGTPQAVVSPAKYDFGQIGPDNPVTTTFAVSNPGSGPLQIESVATSCGCTTAQISSQTIAAGASADLTVTFDPQAHAGATGQFLRYVYLRTNDPTAPEVEVEIRADVPENPIAKEISQ
jgi:hypothetical protein